MNKDEALIEYCKTLLQDAEVVEQQGWQKLIVIGEVTSASIRIFGYSYNMLGEGQLIAPSNGKATDSLKILYQLMQADNDSGRGWLKCMVRISRAGEVGAEFEYNDARRWEQTTDNYMERIKEYVAMPV